MYLEEFNPKDPDRVIGAENAAVPHMTPEELERYAAAELQIKEAEREIESLIERARVRVAPWPEEADPAVDAMLAWMSPGLRNIVRRMKPEELSALGECIERIGSAGDTRGKVLIDAGKREAGER
jgi:hypothetical protein